MRRLPLLLSVFVALAPRLALAGGPEVLDLKDGVPRELLGKMLGVAWGLFAISLVVGLLVEAFRGSPTEPKSYGGVAWRTLVVMALLSGYPKIFGTIIATAESLADRIAPADVWASFIKHQMETMEALAQKPAAPEGAGAGTQLIGGLKSAAEFVAGNLGGSYFDSFVAFFVAVAQAFQWAFVQFSRILLALFYVMGPLALVFHIPAPSQTAGRWFKAFVTIATWPIFSALLLALANALLYRTHDAAISGAYATAFGAVASSLLLVVLNLAVPLLASATVGGSVRNIIVPSLGAAVFATMKAAGLVSAASAPIGAAGAGATPTPSAGPSPSPGTSALSVPPAASSPDTGAFRPDATARERPSPGYSAGEVQVVLPPVMARRPPGLATKDMTVPAPAQAVPAAAPLPGRPPLPPERTALLAAPPPAAAPAPSLPVLPPPPPPDAD